MKANKYSLSVVVSSVFNAWASAPFRPLSQQDRLSCKYAPRPASLPVESICIASGRRTMRINERFGNTSRQPTQVRWGTCFRLVGFLDT